MRDRRVHCECLWSASASGSFAAFAAHERHVAEAYREARTIRDEELLRILPERTHLRGKNGHGIVLGPPGNPRGAYMTNLEGLRVTWKVDIPALVVWTPRDEAR